MFASFFGWLRHRTTQAIFGGIHDAIEAIGAEEEGENHISLESLKTRLALVDKEKPARKTTGK